MKTIFIDIDGTIFKHGTNLILPGVKEKFQQWLREDCKIIITTGRKESLRQQTEEDLKARGVVYDLLIMGLPRGPRVVINDYKPDNPTVETAIGWTVKRDEGLESLL